MVKFAYILLSALSLCLEAEDINLELRVQQGQDYRYLLVIKTTNESRSTLSNAADHEETEDSQEYQLHVLEASKESTLFEKRITAATVKGHSNGLDVDYDSSRGDGLEQLSDSPAYIISRTVGQTYKYRVDGHNNLLDADDLQRVLVQPGAGMPADPLTDQLLKSGLVQFGLAADLMAFPRWHLHPGVKWSTVRSVTLLGAARLRMRQECTFSGVALYQGRAVALVSSVNIPMIDATDGKSLDQALSWEFKDAKDDRIDLATGLIMEEVEESDGVLSFPLRGGDGKKEVKQHSKSTLTLHSQ